MTRGCDALSCRRWYSITRAAVATRAVSMTVAMAAAFYCKLATETGTVGASGDTKTALKGSVMADS